MQGQTTTEADINIAVLQFETRYDTGKERDFVLLAPRGESLTKCQTWKSIKSITPPNTFKSRRRASSPGVMHMNLIWEVVRPLYEKWKKSGEIPEDGTPLAAWPGVTKAQVDYLKSMGIVTVEHVAKMTEKDLSRVPFQGARKLPGLASQFLKSQSKASAAKEITDLKSELEALKAMINAQGTAPAPDAIGDEAPAPKKKRGRPTKAEIAAKAKAEEEANAPQPEKVNAPPRIREFAEEELASADFGDDVLDGDLPEGPE